MYKCQFKKGNLMEPITKFYEGTIKAFDDSTLTIEHFISTEGKDRSGDIVRADGMRMDGVPVVLKQHGFDVDTGREPIAKPVSIEVGKDGNGTKGILAKTQYFDGSKLTPPDNTGQRLYEKAKEKFMPYWSIGFTIDESEGIAGGGKDILKWNLLEYSQVGVPDNIQAKVIKSMDCKELHEKANKLLSFKLQKEDKEISTANTIDQMFKSDETREKRIDLLIKDYGLDESFKDDCMNNEICDLDYLEKILMSKKNNQPSQFVKSIQERISEELPWEAMYTIWWAFTAELYSNDGSEKETKKTIKELSELITPYAIDFAKATSENREEYTEIKELIDISLNPDKLDSIAESAPIETTQEKDNDKPPIVFRLTKSISKPKQKTIKLPCSLNECKEKVVSIVKEFGPVADIHKVMGKFK